MNDKALSVIRVNVVVVGDAGVGKTSLVLRFTQNDFDDYVHFIQGAMPSIRILGCEDKSVVFTISEITGTERFPSFSYRDAGIALILYDISSHEGQLLAERHDWYFAETSAKSGEGVERVFHDMGSALVESCKKEKESSTVSLCDSYVHRMKKTCC